MNASGSSISRNKMQVTCVCLHGRCVFRLVSQKLQQQRQTFEGFSVLDYSNLLVNNCVYRGAQCGNTLTFKRFLRTAHQNVHCVAIAFGCPCCSCMRMAIQKREGTHWTRVGVPFWCDWHDRGAIDTRTTKKCVLQVVLYRYTCFAAGKLNKIQSRNKGVVTAHTCTRFCTLHWNVPLSAMYCFLVRIPAPFSNCSWKHENNPKNRNKRPRNKNMTFNY